MTHADEVRQDLAKPDPVSVLPTSGAIESIDNSPPPDAQGEEKVLPEKAPPSGQS